MASDFDWKSFAQFFGGQLPEAPVMNGDFSKWVEDYVQSIINNTIREPAETDSGGDLPFDLFETERSLVVKLTLPPQLKAQNLNIRAGHNQLRIGGLPHGRTQRIILPVLINNRRCRAQVKNGTLQITAPKTEKNNDFVSVLLLDDSI